MQLEKYLKDLFADGIKNRKPPSALALPLYLKNGYELFTVEIHGLPVLFIKPLDKETPATLKMHASQFSGVFGLPCVVYLDEIDPQEKRRLLQNGTSFVVPGAMFFAPNIGISLNERIKEIVKPMTEKFTPLTQVVYLYLLYNRNYLTKNLKDPITYSLISVKTGLNPMTVKRGIDILSYFGLVTAAKRNISFLYGNAEYIEKALPYLDNPIKKSFFITEEDFNKHIYGKYNLINAGLSALQDSPYISDRRRIAEKNKTYAIEKKSDILYFLKDIKMKRRYEPSDIEIQVWNYAPDIYGRVLGFNGHLTDPLSLYLSLRNIKDERVQGALEELLEGIKNDLGT